MKDSGDPSHIKFSKRGGINRFLSVPKRSRYEYNNSDSYIAICNMYFVRVTTLSCTPTATFFKNIIGIYSHCPTDHRTNQTYGDQREKPMTPNIYIIWKIPKFSTFMTIAVQMND